MKLMGMMTTAHWTSWVLTSMLKFFIIVIIFVTFLKLSFSKNGPVIAHTSMSLFIAFLFCYGVAMTSFACMISVFIQRGKEGGKEMV